MIASPPPPCAEPGASALAPLYAQLPFAPVAGHGARLVGPDGREVVDFYGGHAVALLGYGHPRLTAAIERQTRELLFQSNAVPMAVRERAASALAALAPEGLSQVLFVNSGAEANENALRLAFRATGRSKVVAVEGAFHGRTAAAAAVTWGAERWYAFPRRPFDVVFAPRDAAALAAAVDDATAAVILEPVQGVAGAVPLGRDLLAAARAATERVGALLVLDEVQTGMGRTGAPFAARLHGIAPDLLTVGKGLAGGLPAAAVVARPEALAGLAPGDLGTTFGGGPVVMAAVEAVIGALVEEGLMARAQVLSGLVRRRCQVGPVTAIQGEGLLLGLCTTRPAAAIQRELLARGFLVGTSADPHVVRLLPPLVLRAAEVEALAIALEEIPA
ncbi:MAG: aspartate aminotransferase family protein [Thermoanaerobaculia bacterium]|nr:aspartate aminotransferase family protein [Thermoanaerobaculia bacterium]